MLPTCRILVLGLACLISTGELLSLTRENSDQASTIAIKLTAYGRAGHGSSLNRSSAPHRLLRALSRLLGLSTDPRTTSEVRGAGVASIVIQSIRAGEKVNVTPGEATALLQLQLLPGTNIETLLEDLSEFVGNQVEVELTSSDSTKESGSI